jgi:hypothetical protein
VSDRWTFGVTVVLVLAFLGFCTADATGVVSVGDPFLGTWRIRADMSLPDIAIKRTGAGYAYTLVYSDGSTPWVSAVRRGDALASKQTSPGTPVVNVTHLVFKPWGRHLVVSDSAITTELVYRKASDTSAAPPLEPH